MQHFSPVRLGAAIVLATALAACGSSSAPNASTGTTSNSSATSTTTGNTGVIGNANTPGNTNTTTAASISVTGSLGGMAFTGKDAVYASDSLNGITYITAVLSDSAGLCDAFGGAANLDGNLLVIQLITNTGADITVGDYTVQDSNATTTSVIAGTTTTATAGAAAVSILATDANSSEIDASSGDIKVTSYTANNPLVFTISAQATGSTAGITGNASAPSCAALATALQSSNSTTTASTKLARARRVFISNLQR